MILVLNPPLSSQNLADLEQAATSCGAKMQGAQLAAASLAVQMAALSDEIESGLATSLMINPENLKNRCERLEIQIRGQINNAVTEVCEREVQHGPCPWNQLKSSGWAVRLTVEGAGKEIWQAIAGGSDSCLPVLLDLDETGSLWIDLRFVPPEDDHEVVTALVAMGQADDV